MIQFSIVVPVYNKAGFIKQTIHSILSQSYTNFEVIVIDDGSTDNSVAIVEAISDPRVKLIKQTNAGVSVARNNGINQAKAQWVCFLDADDWYHPNYLESILGVILAHPQLNVIAATFIPLPDSPDWRPPVWQVSALTFELIDNLPDRWMKGIPFFTSSVSVSREALRYMQPCFPPGESAGEDLDLWFRLAEKNKILLIQQPLVVYRTDIATSLSVNSKHIETPFIKRIHTRAHTLPAPLNRSTLKFVTHFYCTAARSYAYFGSRLTGLELMKKSFAIGKFIPRYWVTLAMILLMPGSLIQKWQSWKISKSTTKLHSDQ